MPKEETKVTNLRINYLTREQYDAEKVAGRLSETELYMTPSGGADIPTKTSDLINDSGFLTEHQDISGKVDKVAGKGLSANDYTTEEKNKLSGIAAGAEVNVQPNWNQTNTSADDYIKNKPSVPTALSDLTDDSTHRLVTDTEKSTWNGKQNSISDLSTIRSGAALGATALQSFTETDPTVPNWAKQNSKPSYTANEVGAVAVSEKGAANGVASLGADGKVPSGQLPAMDYIPTSQKGAAGGVASLGADGKVPTSQIPSLSYIPTSQKGAENGIASLGADGKVPSDQLPPMDYIPTSQKGTANGVAPLNSSSKIADTYLPSYVGKTSGSSSFTMGRDANGIYIDY